MNGQERGPTVALFGAAPDTLNMGVSAMFSTLVAAIKRRLPSIRLIVFDNGLGERRQFQSGPDPDGCELVRYGARGGRRYYRPENLTTIALMSDLGAVGARLNRAVRLIDSCDAVLDLSGGDSFSDIYGARRFHNIVRPKLVARKRGVPLFLLPQTYGPYTDPRLRAIAAAAVRGAEMAWARDRQSFERLKELLGGHFDAARHCCGVDLAFGLEPRSAAGELGGELRGWLDRERVPGPLIGFNVSGLIYADPEAAAARYGFRADYRRLVLEFLAAMLRRRDLRIVLVPHVMTGNGHYESDHAAAERVREKLAALSDGRIAVAPRHFDQAQVKWLISRTDWFCGTRMHATIAALGSGVPAAAIAYSDKTKGVFEGCGQLEHVIDPRRLETGQAVDALLRSFEARAAAGAVLRERLPAVRRQAEAQMDTVAERILAARRRRVSCTRAAVPARGARPA